MYATGEVPIPGDIVNGSGGDGEVLEIVPNGVGGQENAVVQWSTVHEISPGFRGRKAPVQVPTQSLRLVSRKFS